MEQTFDREEARMSAPCPERLEVLGAWLDGEATEAEEAELQRHLTVCPGCREASGLLADLGSSVAHQPTVEVPADFAARTARVALAATAVDPGAVAPGGVERRSGWRGWAELVAPARRWAAEFGTSSGGGAGVLGVLLGREGRGKPSPALVLVLFGGPAFLLGLYNPMLPDAFLKIAAACLLVALPVHHWQARAARLGSLQRGRALEEILLSGMSPARLLDGLAVAGLGSLAWAALGFEVLLLPTNEVLWLPAVLVMAWLGSYAAACWSLGEGLGLLGLGAASLVAAWSFWPGLAAGCLALAGCRWLALRRLGREPVRLTRAARNRWLLNASDNPIVMRESARRAGQSGRALRYLPLIALSSLWASWVSLHPESEAPWVWLALPLAGILANTAVRTLGAVLHERERGTWEPLLQSGGAGREFVAGWLLVATGEAALGLAALLPLALVATGLSTHPHPVEEAWLVVGSLALAGAAALLGLALSARSRTLGEARSSLLAWGCGLAVTGVALTGVAQVLHLGLFPAGFGAVGAVGALTALWSAHTLHASLTLSAPAKLVPSLPARLAVCTGCAGAALGLVVHSWPRLPALEWASVVNLGTGFAVGWLTGLGLAWVAGPALRIEGQTRLARWTVTVAWAATFGLALGGLRLLVTCFEWLDPMTDAWTYDQIALSVGVAAAAAAALALRQSGPTSTLKPWALALIIRLGLAGSVLGAFVTWQFHRPTVDVEPILAQVQARREAARQLPPGATRIARLLRGDWPAGASAPYLAPETLRARLIEVVQAIRRGEIPASNPGLPLAMDIDLLVGVEATLRQLAYQEDDLEKRCELLLLAVDWAAQSRILSRAELPLDDLERHLSDRQLSPSQLRQLVALRVDQNPQEVCDDLFARDLEELAAEKALFPDRPEFYWSHQRQVLEIVYQRIRPACARGDFERVSELQREALSECGPRFVAERRVMARYAAFLQSQQRAGTFLIELQQEAQRQLEGR